MYKKLLKTSNKYGERNDCSVKAVAVALDTTYEDAHTLLKEHGRKLGKGVNFACIRASLQSRGFSLKLVSIPRYIKTIKNLEDSSYLSDKPYLIRTSSHVIGFRDNKAQDYTTGRRFRIIEVYEVIAEENAIHRKEVGDLNIFLEKKKTLEYRYALAHKETGEVYNKFKVLRKSTKRAVENGTIYIVDRKEETLGKLEIIEL